ncbi:MAG: FKBP-type peptidyl-prolyl cis-trans isomerase FkpA precursor [Chitinophagaceae bacterium]|nr:FKBP-type peptidyl-prolyl cis-trans isomerase FkpA precursor [Chitinophagaceae bacterium]
MKKLILGCFVISLAAISCTSVSYDKTKTGLKYKIFEAKNKGAAVQPGKFIKFNVEYRLEARDSVLQSTYGKFPGYAMVDTSGKAAYSFMEVVSKMKVGDSIVFIMSIDSLKSKGMIQGYDAIFHRGDNIKGKVAIIQVFDNDQVMMADYQGEVGRVKEKEVAAIESYLKKNNITAQKTKNGAFVEITQQGNGEKVDSGKLVAVKYRGYLLDNKKVFDTNMDSSFGHTQPYELVLGNMSVIPGWEEALPYFTKGAKGKVFVPSSLAYGMQGQPPVIPAFANLGFDMEVVDIKVAPKNVAPQSAPPAR